jgi:hypothetical protein
MPQRRRHDAQRARDFSPRSAAPAATPGRTLSARSCQCAECVPNPLQINRFRPEVELSGGGNLFVAFRRAASRAAHGRRHPRGARRPHRARARGLRGPSPPHTHAPQLLRYRIGAYGRGATRVPLYTVLSYYLLLTNPGFSCHPWSWHCLLSSSRTSPTLRT